MTQSDGEERRKNSGLTDEQVDQIKEQILSSLVNDRQTIDKFKNSILGALAEDFGRSLFTKILWALGTVFIGLLAWLSSKGYIAK